MSTMTAMKRRQRTNAFESFFQAWRRRNSSGAPRESAGFQIRQHLSLMTRFSTFTAFNSTTIQPRTTRSSRWMPTGPSRYLTVTTFHVRKESASAQLHAEGVPIDRLHIAGADRDVMTNPQSIVSQMYLSVVIDRKVRITAPLRVFVSSCHRVFASSCSCLYRPVVLSVSFLPLNVVTLTVVPSVSTITAPS